MILKRYNIDQYLENEIIKLPKGAKLLAVELERIWGLYHTYVYVLVDPNIKTTENYDFKLCYFRGEENNNKEITDEYTYLGFSSTKTASDENLFVHVFYKKLV